MDPEFRAYVEELKKKWQDFGGWEYYTDFFIRVGKLDSKYDQGILYGMLMKMIWQHKTYDEAISDMVFDIIVNKEVL